MADYYQGLRLGEWGDGTFFDFYLSPDVYQWPMYVLGVPGTGKSTLLANLALRLHGLGEGVLVIDTKDGDLAEAIVQRTPAESLIYMAPGHCYFEDGPHHWGLNPLESPNHSRAAFAQVYSNVLSMFERIDRADYSIMTQVKGNLDLAIPLSLYLPEPTILDVRRIMTERAFRDPIIAGLPDSASELKKGWQRFNAMSERDQRQEVASTLRRLVDMLITPQRYFMLTQYRSGLRIRQWLDEGKMVVCNLAGGQMEDSTARLLGNLVLAVFMNEAMVRPVGEPRVWRLVADEFDRLAGNNFAELIEKARSRKVFPIMAHQNLDQLKRDRGNNLSLYQSARAVPVVFTFRASADDVYSLRRIHGDDYGEGLSTMKDFTAQLTLTRGLPGLVDPGQPVTILLDPLQGADNEAALAAAILSQKAHTVSERALVRRGKIEGDDDTPRPDPLQQGRQPVPPGDDPTGDSDPGTLNDFPLPDLNPGSESLVSGFTQQPGAGKRRPRRPKSS